MRRSGGWMALLAILIGAGASCSLRPAVHRSDLYAEEPQEPRLPSSDFDLGLRITMEVRDQIGFVEVDSVVRRVNDIGYRVASVVPRPALFSFHVIDFPDPNAFALPGGFIFVTQGMMDLNLTDAELAALLGHEIGHVIHGHFSRSQRLSSVLSLAQLALLVGVLLAADDYGTAGSQYEVSGDQITRGTTGKEAMIEGVPLFGGFFRTLLERKYSRGLEMESDETGARLAARAGYPANSARDLLQKLRERIHEDATYGYWLTHPFFKDRVSKATSQARTLQPAVEPPPVYAFRRAAQTELFRIASLREADDEASFLFEMALRAEPHGMTALEAGRELLDFRARRDRQRKPLERQVYPIIAKVDSLISLAKRIDPAGALADEMRADRDSLEAERQRLLPRFTEGLDRALQSTSILEGFVLNFPDHPRLPEMQYALAENYRRSGRWDLSARTALKLRRDCPEGEWRDKAAGTLAGLLPHVKNPCVMQEILDSVIPDSLAEVASARMDSLIVSLETMEEPAAFLDRFPNSHYADPMRQRLDAQAEKAYIEAKILEGVGRPQRALDAYHRILFLAPDSKAAQQARERIDYLVKTS